MKRVSPAALFILISALSISPEALAARGDADTAFGTNGTTVVDFSALAGANSWTDLGKIYTDSRSRTWIVSRVNYVSGMNAATGVGVTRLTRNGLPDPSFGTAGSILLPDERLYGITGLALKSGGGAYFSYADSVDNDTTSKQWQVCSINDDGSSDASNFTGGCSGAQVPYAFAAVDVLIEPVTSNVWIFGSTDYLYELQAPAVLIFNLTSHSADLSQLFTQQVNIDARAAVMDGQGGLYFAGTRDNPSESNFATVMGHIARVNGVMSMTLSTPAAFTSSGAVESNAGECIGFTPDDQLVVGVNVSTANFGNGSAQFGSVKYSRSLVLDPTYGNGGIQQTVPNLLEYGGGPNDYSVNACSMGADGSVNIGGDYYMTDPTVDLPSIVPTLLRLTANGGNESGFGGSNSTPGVFYPIAFPGAAMNFVRPLSQPRPHSDSIGSVNALPNGSVIVAAASKRLDGSGLQDVVLMRLKGDGIFADGFE